MTAPLALTKAWADGAHSETNHVQYSNSNSNSFIPQELRNPTMTAPLAPEKADATARAAFSERRLKPSSMASSSALSMLERALTASWTALCDLNCVPTQQRLTPAVVAHLLVSIVQASPREPELYSAACDAQLWMELAGSCCQKHRNQ